MTFLDSSGVEHQQKALQAEITELKARLEKAEREQHDYRKTSSDLLSGLATELEKHGYGRDAIVSVLGQALGGVFSSSTPEEIAETKRAQKQ